MPDASEFTRMKRMVADANVYRPTTSPAQWVPVLPFLSLSNMIRSNKFRNTPILSNGLCNSSWIYGGDPYSVLSQLMDGGNPSLANGCILSGGIP